MALPARRFELDLDYLTTVVPPREYGRDRTQSGTLDRHLPSAKNTHASESPNRAKS
jgi:hypothetical protein